MCTWCAKAGMQSGQHPFHHALTGGELREGSAGFSSGAYYIDALTSNISWTGTVGQSSTVTYNFTSTVEGGSLFNSTLSAAALSAMQSWSNVANIGFSSTTSNPNLTFSVTTFDNFDGLTTYFYSGTTLSPAEVQVDTSLTSFAVGSYGYFVMLHELGHALGFKHPGNYSGSDEAPFLPAAEDSTDASVMSYNDGTYSNFNRYAITPMLYDVAAAQYLYGANTATNAGDTNHALSGSAIAATIWDGSGTDNLDARTSTTAVTLDLREGLSYVNLVGSAAYWVAFGANIENALGGSANDTINGNALGNQLYGMAGSDVMNGQAGNDVLIGGAAIADSTDSNDTMYGGAGSDTLYGNSGDDILIGGAAIADTTDSADTIYGGKGADQIYGNSGNDYIAGGGSSVDPLDQADLIYGGKGADEIYGNGSNDTIYGGGASEDPLDEADVIYGGAGADLLFGNGGNDTITGNEDNDTMYGGVGDDTYYFGSGSGADSVMQFDSPGVAGGDVIAVVSAVMATTSALLAATSYSGGSAIIDLGGGNSITIAGISSGLTVDDFLIV